MTGAWHSLKANLVAPSDGWNGRFVPVDTRTPRN